jgi:hypothetical protein
MGDDAGRDSFVEYRQMTGDNRNADPTYFSGTYAEAIECGAQAIPWEQYEAETDSRFAQPSLGLVIEGLSRRVVHMIEECAEDLDWGVRRYDSPADALQAKASRGRRDAQTAISSVSQMGSWGGRDNMPYQVLCLDEVGGDRAALPPGFSYLGGSRHKGGLSVLGFGCDIPSSEVVGWIDGHLREEDPRRTRADMAFEELFDRSRGLTFFSVAIVNDGDGNDVYFVVDSIDGSPGRAAQCLRLYRVPEETQAESAQHVRLKLTPRQSIARTAPPPLRINHRNGLIETIIPSSEDKYGDSLLGSSVLRVTGWRTPSVSLPSGQWRAVVDGGGYKFKLTGEISFNMPLTPHRRIFISYLHSDTNVVSRLASRLESAGYGAWLDRDQIAGGSRWKRSIRDAIRNGEAMIVCFSSSYAAREKTYMNEEITEAVQELRLRGADQTWLIPVRLNQCEIPDRDLGGGESLRDIQSIDLFPDFDAGFTRLLKALARG